MNVIFYRQLAQALVGIQLELKHQKEYLMATFAELNSKIDEMDATIVELKSIAAAQKADLDFAVEILAGAADGLPGQQVTALMTRLVNTQNELRDARDKTQINEGRITPPVAPE